MDDSLSGDLAEPRTNDFVALSSTIKLRRLKPLRVLLSGQDRRFLRVTSLLLALHGYEVSQTRPGETIRAAERSHADVVLLESGPSRGVAAQRVAQLAALAAAPAVVMVTDDGAQLWSGQCSVKKWTPLEELVNVIEAASLRRRNPEQQAAPDR